MRIPALRLSVNWNDSSGGCAIDAHPFDTLILPAATAPVPDESAVSLAFTRQPTTSDGFAWAIDVTALGDDYQILTDHPDLAEVGNYSAMRQSATSLKLDPVLVQNLDLTRLPPGDTVIEIGASWPEVEAAGSSVYSSARRNRVALPITCPVHPGR
jgi:hypothetical protein